MFRSLRPFDLHGPGGPVPAGRSAELTRLIAGLAEGQHGVVSRRQLRSAGIAGHTVDGRVRANWLLPICPGVFAVGRQATSDESVWTAAVLGTGTGACLAGRSAACLWGMLKWNGEVDVVRSDSRVPPVFRMGKPGLDVERSVRVHRSSRMSAREVTSRRGIAVTSVIETLHTLAGKLPEDRLSACFNEADRLGLLDDEVLHDWLRGPSRRKGTGHLRCLIRTRLPETGATRSELESMFLELCLEGGLPMPQVNSIVEGFEVDCHWPSSRLVVELDGFEFHRGRMAAEKDLRRDSLLKRRGYAVHRLTYGMVRREPSEVLELVSGEIDP